MARKISVLGLLFLSVMLFSFFTNRKNDPAASVKGYYLSEATRFRQEVLVFRDMIPAGDSQKLQAQFLKIRSAYKRMEVIVEYYFNYFAAKLNGPPIPFFEEDEPDVGQQEPAGMQVIEGLIFPGYDPASRQALLAATERLYSDAGFMIETNESNAFSEELIFDALTEELYRITAMGLAGFDAQASGNGLPECRAALEGVQKILSLYHDNLEKQIGDKANRLDRLLVSAFNFLDRYRDFNAFPRMRFIQEYLNPVTGLIGEYKEYREFGPNRSPMFYSTIRKNNTLFAPGIFNPDLYLDDNTSSAQKIALGRKLFFDKKLSSDNKHSCASCHDPKKAFTDGLTTSVAIDGHSPLRRNAPTIWNAALQRNLFLDSRSPSLEEQVMQVLNNASEMHGSAQKAAEKILLDPEYSTLYAQAYPRSDPGKAAQNVCNAIACYERTLIALNARFDKHMRGIPSLSQQEINGFNLFMGKAKCGTCHFMPLFSGAKPPRYYYTETEVIGVPDKNLKKDARLDEDEGRFAATGLPMHKYAFKTATLRNIALTAPYMHNGVFKTLEEVMDFYNNGGGKGLHIAPANQTLPFEKLGLTRQERLNIIAFMKSLTDTQQVHLQKPGR